LGNRHYAGGVTAPVIAGIQKLQARSVTFLHQRIAVANAQAATLVRTQPAAGWGILRSTISNAPPGPAICAGEITPEWE
jgi:hypothetical protein